MRVPFDVEAWLASTPSPPPIVQAGAAGLRQRASEVPRSLLATAPLRRLVERMVETMRAAPGVGLAAPQIAVPLRIFVAEDPEERLAEVAPASRALKRRTPLPLLVVVNPELVARSSEEATFFEGCLSVRGYGALVARAMSVRVRGLDAEGRPLSLDLDGWPARIMQHEIDHLDGALYVDRMISRSFACDAELPRLAAQTVDELLGGELAGVGGGAAGSGGPRGAGAA